ncbi:MAG: CoA transferase [Deltaproteobacteria bacterium]|nr:MAG: CoA transferase [Deltaproteobacteria bacterium]
MSELPLSGIRVLDLSRILAGPYCTMQLADLGADVIKVEPPGGDDTRRFAPPWAGEGEAREATYYLAVNRGKRSVVLDLKDPRDLELLYRLARRSDVVVENFRPGVTARLKIDAEHLRRINPRLVYVSISGFGAVGVPPWTSRPGYDLVVQGMGGLPSLTGPEEGAPYKVGASIADVCAGMAATQAVLAALYRRERTGEGVEVDISMMDVQLSLLAYHASAYLMAGEAPERLGNRHPSVHPYSTYRAADGWINVAVGNDALFERFAAACERPEWVTDPRFRTNPDRVRHRSELDREIDAVLPRRTVSEWVERFGEAGIPAGPVLTVPEALDHPQTRARGSIAVTRHPDLGPLPMVASPLFFPGLPRAASRPPPRQDEHGAEIRAWLAADETAGP